jgi:hypothetical protein
MLDLNKTNLIDNVLIITNDDGFIKCIPRDGATKEELELFDEFEKAYPNGKPDPIVVPSTPVPSEIDVLKQSLATTNTNLSQMIDFITSL